MKIKKLAWSLFGTLMIFLLLAIVFCFGYNYAKRPSNNPAPHRPANPIVQEMLIVATGTILWNKEIQSWEFLDDAGKDASHRYRLQKSPAEGCNMDTYTAKMKLKVRVYQNGIREADVLEVIHLEKHGCDM